MSYVMKRYLTEQQIRRLLASMKARAVSDLARRDFAWATLLLRSGMRIGEFSRMTVRQAEQALATGWLFIPGTDRKGGKRNANTTPGVMTTTAAEKRRFCAQNKPVRDHEIPVTKAMRESLEQLLRLQKAFGGRREGEEPLVISQKGGRMAIRSYQERMTFWCREAGIEHASPHWLRHTCGMQIMKHSTAKDPRGVAQAQLGHATISSTGIYTGVTKEELVATMNAIEGGQRLRRREVARKFNEAVVHAQGGR